MQVLTGAMRQGNVTTTDATPTIIPLGQMGQQRGMPVLPIVSAYDRTTNAQQAGFIQPFLLRRFGTAQPTADVGPFPVVLPLSYDPNVAPWNTITAEFDSDAQDNVFMRVTGLAGVEIDWNVGLWFVIGAPI